MKIVVIGGTGLIGSKTVRLLKAKGHEVIAASPSSGVDTMTGAGLAEALANTDVVIDLANSPSFADQAVLDFFQTSGRNLLAAEAAAGVKHHIALSVVGTEDLQESGYFRGKLVQERLIKASPVPYTIIHSTQFLEFLGGIVKSAGDAAEIEITSAYIQPMASDDVAQAVADVALAAPVNGTVEIAGPETFRMADLVARYLKQTGGTQVVKSSPAAKYFGATLRDNDLVPRGQARLGAITFDAWMEQAKAPV